MCEEMMNARAHRPSGLSGEADRPSGLSGEADRPWRKEMMRRAPPRVTFRARSKRYVCVSSIYVRRPSCVRTPHPKYALPSASRGRGGSDGMNGGGVMSYHLGSSICAQKP
jgi:hypothetical protein